MFTVVDLPGALYTQIGGINDRGDICGEWADPETGFWTAFVDSSSKASERQTMLPDGVGTPLTPSAHLQGRETLRRENCHARISGPQVHVLQEHAS